MRDPKTGNVPNESKLQRALMPNSRMFLLFLIVFAVLTFFFSDRLWLSIGEGVIILLLIIYSVIMRARKRARSSGISNLSPMIRSLREIIPCRIFRCRWRSFAGGFAGHLGQPELF